MAWTEAWPSLGTRRRARDARAACHVSPDVSSREPIFSVYLRDLAVAHGPRHCTNTYCVALKDE